MSDPTPADEELQTARLSLRRPTEADIDAIFAIHSDPGTCLHNPSDALARPEEARELYQRWNGQWQSHGYGYWVVRRHNSAPQLGFCGIKPVTPPPAEAGGFSLRRVGVATDQPGP